MTIPVIVYFTTSPDSEIFPAQDRWFQKSGIKCKGRILMNDILYHDVN